MGRKGGFITVSSGGGLTAGSSLTSSTPVICQPLQDKAFFDVPLKCTTTPALGVIEWVYHMCSDPEVPQPLAVFVDDDDTVGILTSILKHLLPVGTACVGMSSKTKRAQAQKLIRKGLQANRAAGVLVLTTDSALFVSQSCLPAACLCKTVVHASEPATYEMWKRRCSLLVPSMDSISSTSIRSTGTQIRITTQSSGETYPCKRNWISAIQARVAVSRKLVAAEEEASTLWRPAADGADFDDFRGGRGGGKNGGSDGDGGDEQRRQGLSGKIAALETRLRVLMAADLPGSRASKVPREGALCQPLLHTQTQTQSSNQVVGTKQTRVKMLLLGMLHEPGAAERTKLAQDGRSLAVTQWLDLTSGQSLGLFPWETRRLGASQDAVSLVVRDIVEAFRVYVVKRSRRGKTGKEGAGAGGQPVRGGSNEAGLVSRRLREALKGARIVAFNWHPSPFGEDGWGGKYGKACAHNEVVFFFARPFAPMEVCNTHCCSRSSPAPGNEGHDGCLEFLAAQCAFFGRQQTVWDSTSFIFIDASGRVSSLAKSTLLHSLDESALRSTMRSLRRLTIECGGTVSPAVLLERIQTTAV